MSKLYCLTPKGAAAGYCECCSGAGNEMTLDFYTEREMPITPMPVTESLLPENYTEGLSTYMMNSKFGTSCLNTSLVSNFERLKFLVSLVCSVNG